MWQEVGSGNITIVGSLLLVTETPVKPMRDRNADIESQYRDLFASNAVVLLEASLPVFEDAARIRAETGLKTPDAIHAATALRAQCAFFITNDTDFRRVEELPIVILDDFLWYEMYVYILVPNVQNAGHAILFAVDHRLTGGLYAHQEERTDNLSVRTQRPPAT